MRRWFAVLVASTAVHSISVTQAQDSPAPTAAAVVPVSAPNAQDHTAAPRDTTDDAPSPTPADATSATAAHAPPREQTQKEKKTKNNVLSLVLAGTGGAMIGVGFVVGREASKRADRAMAVCPSFECATSTDLQAAQKTNDEAETLALATDVLIFGGLGVVASAFIVAILTSSGERTDGSSDTTAMVHCAPGTCGLVVRGGF